MTAQGKNNDFPDKDTLLKYLKGELTPEESHRIEKLILNDPFYREALEGLESTDAEQVDKDLAEISGRIKMRSQTGRRSYIQVYRIAAAVALVAVFSYIIIVFTSRIDGISQRDAITQKQEDIEELTPPEEKSFIDPQDVEKPREYQPSRNMDDIQESQDNVISERREEQSPEPGEAGEQDPGFEISDKALAEELQAGREIVSDMEEERYVTEALSESDEDYKVRGARDPESTADAPEEKLKAREEMQDLSAVEAPDLRSRTQEEPAAKTSDYKSRSENKRQRSERDDMPVAAKISEVTAVPAVASERYDEGTLLPEPVIGFEAYTEYIKVNLRFPAQEIANKTEGVVEVQFIVNRDSIPDKFKIIRSLCDNCDKEAIRLLKEGPIWIPAYSEGELKEVEVNYIVPFEFED
jgi:hypothetical protein